MADHAHATPTRHGGARGELVPGQSWLGGAFGLTVPIWRGHHWDYRNAVAANFPVIDLKPLVAYDQSFDQAALFR